jgi:ferredoxin
VALASGVLLNVLPASGEERFMAVVITELCVGTCDTACVAVCPVDCIEGPIALKEIEAVPKERRGSVFPTLQLFIDADVCICCGACVPECPVKAIFYEEDLPPAMLPSVEANAAFFRSRRAR